ncbi:hypothetical protein ACFL3Q_10750, partial [Planctomycetota bacterium]
DMGQLMIQVGGGKVAKGVVDVYPAKSEQKKVTLRLSRLNKLLGIEISAEKAMGILSALSFEPEVKDDSVICTVPSWRSDVYREVDLIEEVARVHGYDKVPTERKIKIEVVSADPRQKFSESIRAYLNACGFYETINVAFVNESVAGLFSEGGAKQHLAVRDEMRKSASLLRQTLIGSLLGVLKTNVNAKNLPCRIYEIADTFMPTEGQDSGLPIQKTKLALVCDGDFRDLRGVVEGLVNSISKDAQVDFAPADLIWAQTGAEILLNSQPVGTAGVVSQAVREKLDFKDMSPCAVELEFEMLMSLAGGAVKVKPIPRFPAIQRDLSIIVGEEIRWADIIKAVENKACAELEEARFVGIYRGKGVPSGSKSVTLSLRFRDDDGTLTHDAVDLFESDIVRSLTESTKAELRTV